VVVLKVNSVVMIYVLAAIARLLYAGEGTVAHYAIHSDIPVSYFLSAGVGIVIAIALLLPLSRRLALFFVGISVVSGLIGFAEMSWIYVTEGETNPVTAPLVGAIVFSALLYLKPRLTGKE
jgi:K+-transporting ATPase A subunit